MRELRGNCGRVPRSAVANLKQGGREPLFILPMKLQKKLIPKAARLTRLIVRRTSLRCHLLELQAEMEVLEFLEAAGPFARCVGANAGKILLACQHSARIELLAVEHALVELSAQIAAAWATFNTASDSARDSGTA